MRPHFRFADKGINVKRFFEEPKTFDLVLSITGPGVVPYLDSGPMITSEEWWALQQQFDRTGFMTFALWANWKGAVDLDPRSAIVRWLLV